MRAGEEGAEGGADRGTEGGAVGGVFDYRAGWICQWECAGVGIGVFAEGTVRYRSMMVMRGETRPDAQAAAVKSDAIRHGKFFVFQS